MNKGEVLEAINKFLESEGWDVSIIGFKGITKRKLKYNYSLVIDFTGKKCQ